MLRVEHLRVAGMPPLSFEVPTGEALAVLGPSGAGKTRLLRALADLDPADGADPERGGGLVFLAGAERGEMPGAAWRQRVRYVATEPAWWTDTVRRHLPGGDGIGALMRRLDLAPALLDRPVTQLTSSEARRLALVLALADEPRVLLLDEPVALLGEDHGARVEEELRAAMAAGRIIVFATHDPGLARRLAHAELHLADPARAANRRRTAA